MSKFNLVHSARQFLGYIWQLNKRLVAQMLMLLLVFQFLRTLFFILNIKLFPNVGIYSYIKYMFYGIRFDLVAILICNSLYIFLSLLPFYFVRKKLFGIVLSVVFVLTNSSIILLNTIDMAYFRVSHKRITFDFLSVVTDSAQPNLILDYFINYWYLFLVYLFIVFIVYKVAKYQVSQLPLENKVYGIVLTILNFILIGSLVIVGARGGTQMRPITIANAAEYAESQNIPLVLNSAFTFFNTISNTEQADLKYYNDSEVEKIYNPIHFLNHNKPFTPKNVVLIVLESFSKENIGYFNHDPHMTPFLDSLMQHASVFTNGFANATRSIEGIPAILASIPHLGNNAFITSPYSANQVTSIANLLNAKGYNSTFYHGGRNGTMSFDAFTKLCGYSEYYGLNEYPNKNDFDGKWGIWDEPYLQYFAKELNAKIEPFFSTVFTLSSHDPYAIPEKYKNKFHEGKLPITKTISYTDYALNKFFESIKNTAWFKNTVFVFTADHTSITESAAFANSYGYHKIPIIFYQYNQEPKLYPTITQQIDILPNLMEFLNYDQSYFSFGKSTMNNDYKNNISVNFVDNIYQTFNDTQLVKFDTKKVVAVYNLKTDSLLQNNSIGKLEQCIYLNTYTKAYLQTYVRCLKSNKMTVQNYFE